MFSALFPRISGNFLLKAQWEPLARNTHRAPRAMRSTGAITAAGLPVRTMRGRRDTRVRDETL